MSRILAPQWSATIRDLPANHADEAERLALIRTVFDAALADHEAERAPE